uniref:Uncharacterized protein n=1 Tax=Arundo donax TaxID=35708 RepID=A0A0A9BV57_ARUDO
MTDVDWCQMKIAFGDMSVQLS